VATGNIYKKVGYGFVVFEICKRTKQKETDILITVLHTPPRDKVNIVDFIRNMCL